MPLNFLCIQLEKPPQTIYADALETHATGRLCQTSEALRSPAQISRPWFCPCWPEFPFLPCWSSRGSTSIVIHPAIQWWWPGHLHTGFPRDILYGYPGTGLPEPWWTARGSSKSIGERPLSYWTLHSGCNQHTLCFWHFHICSVWAAQATHQCLSCEGPTRWHVDEIMVWHWIDNEPATRTIFISQQ